MPTGGAHAISIATILGGNYCYLGKRRSKTAGIVGTCLELSPHGYQVFNVMNVRLYKPKSKTMPVPSQRKGPEGMPSSAMVAKDTEQTE